MMNGDDAGIQRCSTARKKQVLPKSASGSFRETQPSMLYQIRFSLRHLLTLTAGVALLLVMFLPFRGLFPPFYYEEFNGVKRRLEAIPDLQIVDSWQHRDITLEDCGFDIKVNQTGASLTFNDHQDWVGLFAKIDGVRYSTDGVTVFISRKHLADAGIEVVGLTDVLENLADVLSICEAAEGPEFEIYNQYINDYQSFKHWVKIRKLRTQ